MEFWFALIVLGVVFLTAYFLLLVTKGKRSIFTRQARWYCLGMFLGFALLGVLGLLFRGGRMVPASLLFILIMGVFAGAGILHRYLLYSVHPWASERSLFLEITYTVFVMALTGLGFFLVFWMLESPGFPKEQIYADNFVQALLVFPLPFLMLKSFDYWEVIPEKKYEAWKLPVDDPVPHIEPGRSLILHFYIPVAYKSPKIATFNTRAPVEKTLGQIFHYLLYRNNVELNALTRIEIAEGNSRSKLYGWVFYTKKKWLFFTCKKYLDPRERIRNLDLENSEIVHVHQIKTW